MPVGIKLRKIKFLRQIASGKECSVDKRYKAFEINEEDGNTRRYDINLEKKREKE